MSLRGSLRERAWHFPLRATLSAAAGARPSAGALCYPVSKAEKRLQPCLGVEARSVASKNTLKAVLDEEPICVAITRLVT